MTFIMMMMVLLRMLIMLRMPTMPMMLIGTVLMLIFTGLVGTTLGGEPCHLVIVILIAIVIVIVIAVVNQVFIYPDTKTAISGTFSSEGRLVEGCQCEVLLTMITELS